MTIDDHESRRATIEHLLRFDIDGTNHHLYHDDAVLEFPQSGERFDGLVNFREWRDQYPAEVTVRIRRITGSGDVWVGELSVSYDGGPEMLGISVHEFRGDRIAHERIYVTEPWAAPDWRAPWRSSSVAV
jgi:SnoaL-like protein